MKDSFKNHYFLAQNFDNQALKLHLLQLQILLSEDSQYNFFLPRFGLEKRDLLVFQNVKYFLKAFLMTQTLTKTVIANHQAQFKIHNGSIFRTS